jgi:2-polyprenyl-6-hydroxyphenyl methylase/3-demethylubiquinone-9 3-methyltransferase
VKPVLFTAAAEADVEEALRWYEGRRPGLGMANYYATQLFGARLRRCYELAPPRVQQYLDAEISHVLARVHAAGSVLELGCGYGRVLARLAAAARRVVGIDTALESLLLAREVMGASGSCQLALMDATALAVQDCTFDAVVCIQNGICAFRRDPAVLLGEALRVTRPGGTVLLSSYSEAFWPHRLRWFELQAAEGLVGAIDSSATRVGEVVCKDGFRSSTFCAEDFSRVCGERGVEPTIEEVNESSLFCEVTKRDAA